MKTVPKLILLISVLSGLLGCSTTQANKPADLLFKEGEELFKKEKYTEAVAQWKLVKDTYHSAELSTKAELNIADAYFLNTDYIEASAAYEDFRKLHPKHPQADYALFRQGLSYFNQIHGIDTDQTPVKNALAMFDSYLRLYPTGGQLAEVKEKHRDCRDKQLQYELYIGRFYLKTDAFKSAIARLEKALKTFSDSSRRAEVLYYLGKAYLEDDQKAKGRETFGLLLKEFPQSPFVAEATKEMGSSL